MGGIGSGNLYRWDKRDAVEDYRSLDVRRWQRDGLLTPARWFNWQWTRDSEHDRAMHRAQAIRMRLGGTGSTFDLFRQSRSGCTGAPMNGYEPSTMTPTCDHGRASRKSSGCCETG